MPTRRKTSVPDVTPVVTIDVAQAAKDDAAYEALRQGIVATFTKAAGEQLYTTSAGGLFETFLQNLPERLQQHYNCHACREFLNNYGALVTIDESGVMVPAMWEAGRIPSVFWPAVGAMLMRLDGARVTGPFYSEHTALGHARTGSWTHLAVELPSGCASHVISVTKRAHELRAEKLQDYEQMQRALSTYSAAHVQRVNAWLSHDDTLRGHTVTVMADWLFRLQSTLLKTKNVYREANILWRAVTTAPAGFCHISSNVLGTVLEDLSHGLTMQRVGEKLKAKLDSRVYLRPQVAPTLGNLVQADKLIGQLQAAGALRRRYATSQDVVARAIWTSLPWRARRPAVDPLNAGPFAGIAPKQAPTRPFVTARSEAMDGRVDMGKITWDRFVHRVLNVQPSIEWIRVLIPVRGPFGGLATAADLSAPPILQWDTYEERIPVSGYTYHGGSDAAGWGLQAGQWQEVSMIVPLPAMWSRRTSHQAQGVILGIPQAYDLNGPYAGLGLFPSILKSEFHGIRASIEAYSQSHALEGDHREAFAGLILAATSTDWNIRVRVRSGDLTFEYLLERWD